MKHDSGSIANGFGDTSKAKTDAESQPSAVEEDLDKVDSG